MHSMDYSVVQEVTHCLFSLGNYFMKKKRLHSDAIEKLFLVPQRNIQSKVL